jgi:predicted nucleotidyltransferase
VNQLSQKQRELVLTVSARLEAIGGVKAVVLGGSHARGAALPESDIDLGIFYSESDPFSIQSIRNLAGELNDTTAPVVCGFYEWGPWVNGGAWLTIGGHRVDLLYRSLEHVERVIRDAEDGRYQLDYAQQPPFGFFSATYLGELAVCIPLSDPDGHIERLKQQVTTYPEALRRSVVQDNLWAAEFDLAAFAPKFAARRDVYGTAACLARAVNQLVLALFALNRRYLLNDKTALAEIAEFELAPQDFGQRVQKTLASLGESEASLETAVRSIRKIFLEIVALASELYRPRYELDM